MPKFVPVTNPELARNEQDQDADMAKHRAWESKQYVQENRTGDNLTPGVGSMHSIAFSRKVTGKQKMVRNEKGLWVKVEDESPSGSTAPEAVAKVGMTGGGRGLGTRDEFGQRKRANDSASGGARDEFAQRERQGSGKDDRDRGREDRADMRRDGHRDRRDRSPDRDRHRDRRSRSRDRHRQRDRRSSSRDRDRGRDRRKERRRSRSRSRSGDRRRERRERRSRSRSRRRDGRSRSRDRQKEKRRSASRDRDERADVQARDSGMTAAQLASMLCEIWSSPSSKMRSEALERCLSQDVRVTSLSSGAVLSKGIAKVLLAWGEGKSQAQGPAAEPGQSLFVEDGQAGADAATLSLHLYPAGRSPGLSVKGLCADGAGEPLAALYRVESDQINQIWVSNDVPAAAGKEALLGSALWSAVADIVRENTAGAPTYHYNDYLNCEDSLGMGLGSSSVAESWS